MNAIAGLSQQILNQPQVKTPEKSVVDNKVQNKSQSFSDKSNEFKEKFDSKYDNKEVPVSKDNSARDIENSSPDNYEPNDRVIRKSEKVVAEREQSEAPKTLTKQEAMWAFLEQMQQELGVHPSEVLQAFAQMDVDNLSAPPEESAGEFIENLNLDPQGEEIALNLYSQLLTWTSAASLSDQLQQKGQNAEMEVLNKQQYQAKERLAGIGDLSDRFFMNGQHARQNILQSRQNVQGFAEQNPMMAGQSDIADKLMDQRTGSEPMFDSKASAQGQPQTASAGVKSTEELLRQLQMEMKSAEVPTLSKAEMTEVGFQQKLNALKNYAQPQVSGLDTQQPVIPNAQGQAPDLLNINTAATDVVQPSAQAAMSNDNLMAFSDQSSEQGDMSFEGELSAQDAVLGKGEKANQSQFVVKAPQPTETEMSENIREIINKAKVMVKDGGGEMKVSLRPEGMGNVSLKVNVQGGDVTVEMITASDETRKALEKGLADLKESLSSHKLNVDQIKVESAQEAADKLMQERQEQAERHFQERFLQDFKNQNGFKRSAAFGVEPAGRPGSQGLSEADGSEKKKNSERRLDLVA